MAEVLPPVQTMRIQLHPYRLKTDLKKMHVGAPQHALNTQHHRLHLLLLTHLNIAL